MNFKNLTCTILLITGFAQANGQTIKKRLEAVDEYIIQEDYELAEKLLVRILRNDQGVHEAHYKLGLVKSLKGEYRKALPEVSKANQLKPEEPNYCALLGKIWLALNEDEKGLDWLDKALIQDSVLPEALLTRAKYYSGNGVWDLALKDYLQLNRVVLNEPEICFRIGECHFEMSAFEKARNWLLKTVKVNPLDMEARWLLSKSLYALGAYRDGLFHLEQLIKMEGTTPVYEYEKGQFHLALHEFSQARRAYTKAIEGDKNNLNYVFGQIAVEELTLNYNTALSLTDRLLAAYPDMRPLMVLKARILAKKKDLRGARRYFNLAIDGLQSKGLPFVNDVEVYLEVLDYLEQKETEPKKEFPCDQHYIFHWCFAQLQGEAIDHCPENDFMVYFRSPGNLTGNADEMLITGLGYLHINETDQAKTAFGEAMKPKGYPSPAYHIANILNQNLFQ